MAGVLPVRLGLPAVQTIRPFFQPGAKRGERGFCHHTWAINETLDIRPPENPDEVAWPNSTEVSRNIRSIIFSQLRVGDFATNLAKKM